MVVIREKLGRPSRDNGEALERDWAGELERLNLGQGNEKITHSGRTWLSLSSESPSLRGSRRPEVIVLGQ